MLKYFCGAIAIILASAGTISWAAKAQANKAPTVSLTAPVGGSTYTAPANISLAAAASDSDGTISKVEFYQGTTLIGVSNVAPYTFTWPNVSAGTYTLTAKATDNAGAVATSSSASVTVAGQKIVISSPLNGATLHGSSVAVTGTFNGDSATTVLVDNGNSTRVATLSGNTFSATLPIYLGINTLTITVARRDKTYDVGSVTITGGDYPKIAFRSPSVGTFNAPANVTFAVDAFSPTGSISKVSFFNGSVLLSNTATTPYQYTWSNIPKGAYSITAQATDTLGYSSSVSTSITVIGANIPPSVSLTSPANGAEFVAPANLTISANASDSDGIVSMVQFYQNGNLFGATNAPPFSFNWPSIPPGSYSLTANATDNSGAVTVSAPVNVTVVPPNSPPAVSLVSPASSAIYFAPATIALSAVAADPDGTVAKVEFYQGSSLIGTSTSSPYTVNWVDVAAGSYHITAKATDNLSSAVVSAPVDITVKPNDAPIVGLTSPASGTSVFAPASLTLSADASDNDGTIVKVEFFQNGSLIGTATNSPYTVSWTNIAAGVYSLTAKATDNLGGASISAPISVLVKAFAPTFVSPIDGAALTGDSVLVKGTFEGPPNAGINVNGAVAVLDANNNFYANVQLAPGSNTIAATLTSQSGQAASQRITVTSDGMPPAVRIAADQVEGIAPLMVTYTIEGARPLTGDVVISGGTASVTQPDDRTMLVTYPSAGTYMTTIRMTDSGRNTTAKTFVTVVQDGVQMDLRFKALWNEMNNLVVVGDKATALTYLSKPAQAKYGPVFDVLQPEYQDIALSFSPPERMSVSADMAEYAITRTINGVSHIFLIYYLRGANGVWQLDSM